MVAVKNKILGISGRKQSGKDTTFNYLLGVEMIKLAIVRHAIEIRADEGCLVISDIFGDLSFEGKFDVNRNNETMREFLAEYVDPFIKKFSFADCLKQDVCINLLGLSYEQVYGTDTEKDSLTHLLWENMPGVWATNDNEIFLEHEGLTFTKHSSGPMSGREVLQYVGTEIFRKMYGDVWVHSTLNKISKLNSLMSIVTDVRFPNEVAAIKEAGGKVIRLTRNSGHTDVHESERVLDRDRFDWNNFDSIIDNEEMNITEQNDSVFDVLRGWDWLDPMQKPFGADE